MRHLEPVNRDSVRFAVDVELEVLVVRLQDPKVARVRSLKRGAMSINSNVHESSRSKIRRHVGRALRRAVEPDWRRHHLSHRGL